jgi:hypothetical protein
VKWLVGPSSTGNRATSYFVSLGDTRRCYRVSLCRAGASGQRRVRCWLPFFGVTGRDSSCHRTEHVDASSSEAFALYVIVTRCGRAPKVFPSVRISVRAVALCASCEPACRANSA